MTRFLMELILRECMEKAQADYDSSLVKPKIDINAKIKLSKEHLKELRSYDYRGSEEEDVIDHIAKVLKILDSIKIPDVDTDRLRMHVFPLSRRFFYKYYSISRAGKNNMISNDKDDGPDYFEFVTWLNSRFKDHRRMDGMTKSALWHSWVKGWGNNELMDDIISSDEEWEESDYGNPPNTDTDSFLNHIWMLKKKGDIWLIKKEHHLKNHSSNVSVKNNASCFDDKKNDLVNEKVCNAEKFEVIKFSLGDNEEYIAISTRENNTWKRNKDSISHICQEIFQKKDEGWTVIRTKE
ncbi:hypothetical protein Tco_0941488 [Tanacetum coccineum]|uniref:Uncharacterized protein n=1 Tax=Tanacetum coccineum TaxID=301880 RepID=A0ABQ5DTP9_9ASTR